MKQNFKNISQFIQTFIKICGLIYIIFLINCAATAPPPGGPEDKEGPTLISIKPENESVDFSRTGQIELNFSESIAPRSVENAVVVRPSISPPPNVDVSRNKIVINFQDSLKKNTTYIVSLGRNIKDYRNNPVQNNIQIAFSTGDRIAQNQIQGTVFNTVEDNQTKILAWEEKNFNPDSIKNISSDYITTVDSKNQFNLSNLSAGNYYLLAVSGSARRISSETRVGLPNVLPVQLEGDTLVKNLSFFLTDKNILQKFGVSKITTENKYLKVNLTHPIGQKNWQNIQINTNPASKILYKWKDDKNPRQLKLLMDSLNSDTTYNLKIHDIENKRGETIAQKDQQTEFRYRPDRDTISPALQKTVPKNNSKQVELDAPLKLHFTEPIKNIDTTTFRLYKSTDTTRIPIQRSSKDDNSMILKPEDNLESDTEYFLKAITQDWVDPFDNKYKDSLLTLKFSTLNEKKFGYMSGKLMNLNNIGPDKLYIRVDNVDSDFYSITKCKPTGKFRFDRLFAGEYRLSLWYDRNQNGKFDIGGLFPPRPSEYYQKFAQTIKIRARWEKSGIKLELK